MKTGPPRISRWWFAALLPPGTEVLLADLDEEYARFVGPEKGSVRAG